MSAAISPALHNDNNFMMMFNRTHSVKTEHGGAGDSENQLGILPLPNPFENHDGMQPGAKTEFKEEVLVDNEDFRNGWRDEPAVRKEFSFNFCTEGTFLKWGDRIAWECKNCRPRAIFPTFVDFICHNIKIHNDIFVLKCLICSQLVSNSELTQHFENHTNNLNFWIGKDSEVCNNLEILNNSDEISESGFQENFDSDEDQPLALLCSKFGKNSDQDVDSNPEKTFNCEHCDKTFKNREKLIKHLSFKHKFTTRKRKPGNVKRRPGKPRLKGHPDKLMKSELDGEKPKKKHLCSYCGKTFSLSYKLKKHYRVHTGEKPYHCAQCGKNFSSCSNLKRHVLIHSGEKPYLCTFCGKSFNHPTTFKTHSYIHAGPRKIKPNLKKYSCEYCNKEFAARSTLTIHIRVHTKERPYHCSICEKSFSQKSALNQHLLNHTGEKPHICSYCLKTFKTVVCLKTHVRTHTGERPYKCGVCEKAFSSQSNLYRHRATHTGVKRFSCDYCGKEFSQRSALGDHINIHTGARPYCCPHCSSCFANKSTLVKHVAIHTMKHAQKL